MYSLNFQDALAFRRGSVHLHVNHITPQSILPYTNMNDADFKKCWSLESLRPLEAIKNITDGANRIRHKMYHNLVNGELNG